MKEESNTARVVRAQGARAKVPARRWLAFWLTVWCAGAAISAVAAVFCDALDYAFGSGGLLFSWPFFMGFVCIGGVSFAMEIWKVERNGGGAKGKRP